MVVLGLCWGCVGVVLGLCWSCVGVVSGLGSRTVDQVLKYTKYPKYIPSTSTGQVLIFSNST